MWRDEFHLYQIVDLCEQNRKTGGGGEKGKVRKLCVSRTRGLYFFHYSLGFRGVSPLSGLLSFQFSVVG